MNNTLATTAPTTLSISVASHIVIADELADQFEGFPLCSEVLKEPHPPGKTYALISPAHLKNGYVQMLSALHPTDIIPMPPTVTKDNLNSTLLQIEKYRRITGTVSKTAIFNEPSKSLLSASLSSAIKLDQFVLGAWGPMMERIATGISSSLEFTTHSLFGNVSGVAAGTFSTSPWDRFVEPIMLNTISVGYPSDGKSVAMREMAQPLNRHAARLFAENKNENALREVTAGAKKSVPVPARRLMTSDPTIESIFNILENEKGRAILLNNGEFSAIVSRIGSYSGPSAKDFAIGPYLTAFDGDPATRDRVKFTQYIEFFGFSINSTCQPGVLRSIFDPSSIYHSSGFLHRLDFVFPDTSPVQRMPIARREDDVELNQIFDRIVAWRLEDTPTQVLHFDQDAREIFADWRYELITKERARGGDADPLIGKLPGRVCRYAGVIAVIDAAHYSDRKPTTINADQVRRAITYVKYLRSHRRRVALAARSSGQSAEMLAVELARFVIENRIGSIDSYELRKAGSVAGIHSEQQLRMALGELQRANWLASGTTIPSRKDEALPRIVVLNKLLERFYQ